MQGVLAFFYGFGVWNWLILAVLLFILEAVVPGVHFLWFGIAAVIVGALAMATGMVWQYQIIAFAVISVLTVFGVRRYVSPEVATSDLDGSRLPAPVTSRCTSTSTTTSSACT